WSSDVCSSDLMFQFFVEVIENFFPVVNRLINRVAKVGHKGVIEAVPERFQLVMTLSEDVVFIAIKQFVKMTADFADLAKILLAQIIVKIESEHQTVRSFTKLIVL